MNEIEQTITEYMDKLPKLLQQAIASLEWRKRVGEIGQKYSLTPDQVSSLEYEALFIMIGMEPEEDFVANVQRELAVSNLLATQIAEEVNTRVFQYVLKSLEEKPAIKPVQSDELRPKPIQNAPNSSMPKVSTPNTSLLSEMEVISASPKNPEPIHTPKIVPPPVNLPGEVEDTVSTIPTSTITLADSKLNTMVQSEQVKVEQTQPKITDYKGTDPYREPIE